MFRAISDGDSEELSRFMGENLNVLSTDRGWTPLYLATYYQDQTMCDMLIKNGADINFPNEDKSTPLFAAIQNPELSAAAHWCAATSEGRRAGRWAL